ncbi:Modification methylase HaeIII [Gallibacterium anatis]|uniref:Cytosine-specific methyltransferase n=1 Tax=Gallibacterium anatis TaxID=750 RepID=A0A377H934_9PAST|nr:DNA cytosine methyltransferase [Gallibacterium anatis]KGQ57969.1 cytosine methyltransferase [Gallibacterium anatis DSM 16844 = F 149]STO38959.1 Modification methylase HaeIII [Gallibacterium anatis]
MNTIDTLNTPFNTPKVRYNVISLFSGLGGMDLGFKGDFQFLEHYYSKNPFDILFANDIFKQAAEIYESNFHHKVNQKSILDLDLDKDLPKEKIDVILGGFPCQSFSYAGKRKGLNDPRGQLYKQMIRVIQHYKPKIFVAENVDGIRNANKTHTNQKIESALDIILKDFQNVGYHTEYHILNAADYGVPQVRKRVIIIGIRNDLGNINDIVYPQPQFSESGIDLPKWISAKQGIDDLWDLINASIPNHTIRDISKAKFYLGKKMQGNNRIIADKPSPTIRAEHHGNIEAHYRTLLEDENDINGWRRLSVRECGRLQSFPDNFIFTASASSAYKAIGNAVPPVMAWHIARSVWHMLEKINK